jgi:periplasmic divalent cation tolerance protein
MAALIVFTTLPDSPAAVKLADSLIQARLAACVHILAAGQSIYRWQGKVEHAEEVTLLIKSTDEAYPRLQNAIRSNHPYDVPEILAVPVSRGLPEYLNWLSAETGIQP